MTALMKTPLENEHERVWRDLDAERSGRSIEGGRARAKLALGQALVQIDRQARDFQTPPYQFLDSVVAATADVLAASIRLTLEHDGDNQQVALHNILKQLEGLIEPRLGKPGVQGAFSAGNVAKERKSDE